MIETFYGKSKINNKTKKLFKHLKFRRINFLIFLRLKKIDSFFSIPGQANFFLNRNNCNFFSTISLLNSAMFRGGLTKISLAKCFISNFVNILRTLKIVFLAHFVSTRTIYLKSQNY